MAWAKIDDRLTFHPKIVAAGNEAIGAWVRMISWCCAFGTDGDIPKTVAVQICGNDELFATLFASRLLRPVDENTVSIHDYLDWQPSSKKHAEITKKRKIAGRLGGLANAKANAQALARDLLEQKSSKGSGSGSGRSGVDLVTPERNGSRDGTEAHQSSNEVIEARPGPVDRVWASYSAHHPRAKLDDKLRKSIRSLLRHFTEDDLRLAVEGNHVSPYHCGQNTEQREYHRADLIFRDAARVNQFIDLFHKHQRDKEPAYLTRAEREVRDARLAAERQTSAAS